MSSGCKYSFFFRRRRKFIEFFYDVFCCGVKCGLQILIFEPSVKVVRINSKICAKGLLQFIFINNRQHFRWSNNKINLWEMFYVACYQI